MWISRRKMHPDERNILVSIVQAQRERKAAAEHMIEAARNLEEAKKRLMRCADILAGKEPPE